MFIGIISVPEPSRLARDRGILSGPHWRKALPEKHNPVGKHRVMFFWKPYIYNRSQEALGLLFIV